MKYPYSRIVKVAVQGQLLSYCSNSNANSDDLKRSFLGSKVTLIPYCLKSECSGLVFRLLCNLSTLVSTVLTQLLFPVRRTLKTTDLFCLSAFTLCMFWLWISCFAIFWCRLKLYLTHLPLILQPILIFPFGTVDTCSLNQILTTAYCFTCIYWIISLLEEILLLLICPL